MRAWLDEVEPGVSSPGALELIEAVLDTGSWVRWDTPLGPQEGIEPAYAEQLAAARERTGLDEAVVTGEGCIRGRRVAVVACEFGFLAGSIGVRAADRLVDAVERATDERLPLLASPTSGGTRMQEGTVAFLQMVKITAAIGRHKAAGNPYLVYLRNPTTGGVLASWGSLGHVTVAEPGALIGFLGPRVYQALYGGEFPEGVQTAENLLAHGIVDAVLPPEQIPEILDRALNVLAGAAGREPPAVPERAARRRRRRAGLGVDPPVPPAGPARRAPAAPAHRAGRRARCAAPAPGRSTPGCSWRWRGSAARRASCSVRTGSGSRPASRSDRPGCARPGAA